MDYFIIWIPIVLLIGLLPQWYYWIVQRHQTDRYHPVRFFVKMTQFVANHQRIVTLVTADGFELAVQQYDALQPKGIVQIVHGAFEHAGRYEELSRFLQSAGYVVIASDHRGHGRSINLRYPTGFMRFPQETVADLVTVTHYIKQLYPNVPVYLYGHSLGSIFARLYLQRHESQIAKLILSGMVPPVGVASLGVFFGNIRTFFGGERGYSYLLERLTVNYGDGKWVSYSTNNHLAIQQDRLMVRRFHVRTCVMMMQAMAKMANWQAYRVQQSALPILLLSGEDDVITRSTKGIQATVINLQRASYTNIQQQVFSGMKHEILHEENKECVFTAIVDFLEQ